MNRRQFIEWSAAGALAGPLGRLVTGPRRASPAAAWPRAPLAFPPAIVPDGETLTARAGTAEIAPGVQSPVWSLGAGPVGPTIRTRTGATARFLLENRLDEPTILHWHGLSVPEAADGHPRLAIGPGASYRYEFPVTNRAGTYWYHAHPHGRTAPQVYHGMAGLLLISDEAEASLGLPSGPREIPLLIQDCRLDEAGRSRYDPAMMEGMAGFFGDTPFGNGIRLPRLPVDSAWYRLRAVNGTNSRILRLALSTGAAMTLIGGDGGLLDAPVPVDWVDLGTGERADLLLDFSALPPGTRVMLKSLPFPSPGGMSMGGMGGMGGMGARGAPQGAELDLLEFEVTRAVREAGWAPRPFPAMARLAASGARRTRTFRFQSRMMNHTINGRGFDPERTDETVPFGDTEVWSFVNEGPYPHPVHVHEIQFQVLSRSGGRERVFPWETGWKDTVLVFPGEQVDIIAAFDQHRGRYLMHCHNLVHEDMGMMLNFTIA